MPILLFFFFRFKKKKQAYKINIKSVKYQNLPPFEGAIPPVLALLYGNFPSDKVKLNLRHNMYF